MIKIKYKKNNSNFFKELKQEVQKTLTERLISKANHVIHFKLVFYTVLFVGFYSLIFTTLASISFIALVASYCLLGLSGILLAFNASHDAVHDTLFKNKKMNNIIHYVVFNLQGVNATLWKKRHLFSHHLFPNVDGCDADIDDNQFIRLSERHELKSFHRFQHIYAFLLYGLYTLHWILIKDFVYLKKKKVANMTNLSYSNGFVFETIMLKGLYFLYMLGLPLMLTDLSVIDVVLAFFIMHLFISIFFVLTLIISHLTMETAFPKADSDGFLPFNYYEHQLSVSMDYHPTNKLANFIFGGFNSHSAHHLFPNIQHTLYTQITPCIQKMTTKHKLVYNRLSILKSIQSHYQFLKKLGQDGVNNT